MNRCERCGGKGWIESYQGGSASWTPSIQQCPDRCDIHKYSEEVQRRLNSGKPTPRPVLRAITNE